MLEAVWDETPRLLALVFLLVFVMLFTRWTEDRRPRLFAGAAAAMAMAMLASPFAGISAVLALLAVRRASAAGAGVLLLALALAARWLPPAVWSALGEASAAHDAWNWHTPKHLAAAGIGWAVLVTICERWLPDWRARWAVLWAFLLLCAPVFHRWLHATLLPQPHRYRIELEAALALAAAFGLRVGRRTNAETGPGGGRGGGGRAGRAAGDPSPAIGERRALSGEGGGHGGTTDRREDGARVPGRAGGAAGRDGALGKLVRAGDAVRRERGDDGV